MLHVLCISLQNYERLRWVSFWYEPGRHSHLHIGLFVLLMCPPCVKEAGFWFSFGHFRTQLKPMYFKMLIVCCWNCGPDQSDGTIPWTLSSRCLSRVGHKRIYPCGVWFSPLRVASPVDFRRQKGCSLVSSVSGRPAHPQGQVRWAAISTDAVFGSIWASAPGSCDSRGRGGCWLVGTWSSSESETRKGGAGSFINKPRRKIVCPCDRKKVD